MARMLLVVLVLVGCAGSPMAVSMMSIDELARQDTNSICAAYHVSPSAKIESEIRLRRVVAESEWKEIEARSIVIGMSECALLCSWGTPGPWGRIHDYVQAGASIRQYVYRPCTSCRTKFVYVERGRVTAWSN